MKAIRILGKPYTIREFPSNGTNEDTYGSCDEAKQEILIREGLVKEMRQDTVLHEVFHGIDYAMDSKMSEKQIGLLATGFLAVIKDNPEFLRYLAK